MAKLFLLFLYNAVYKLRPGFKLNEDSVADVKAGSLAEDLALADHIAQKSGTLKLLYSQYRELKGFAQFGGDLDKDTKERLAQGERIVEVLKQNRNTPLEVAQQVCILYAVVNGFLSQIPVEQIRDFEDGLHEALANEGAGILDAIRSTKKLDESTEAQLKDFLTDAVASYLDRH